MEKNFCWLYRTRKEWMCVMMSHLSYFLPNLPPPQKIWKIIASAWNCIVWPRLKISDLVQAVGIWQCGTKNCRIRVAGGAWNYTTTAAASVRWALFCVQWQCLGTHLDTNPDPRHEHANFLSDLYALSCFGKVLLTLSAIVKIWVLRFLKFLFGDIIFLKFGYMYLCVLSSK